MKYDETGARRHETNQGRDVYDGYREDQIRADRGSVRTLALTLFCSIAVVFVCYWLAEVAARGFA